MRVCAPRGVRGRRRVRSALASGLAVVSLVACTSGTVPGDSPASGAGRSSGSGSPATGGPTGSATATTTPSPPGTTMPSAPATTTRGAPSAPGGRTTVARPGGVWRPRPGTAWQWQLTGTVDTSVDVPIYDLDLFTTSAGTVARLHALGRRVICYVNVGAYEDFRPDRGEFPEAVLGSTNGWPGERWVDVRRLDVLAPILGRRLDLCRQKGFDGVEPDNVDGYDNHPGFPITADQQLSFDRVIASLAHARGLSVGLKNDLEQVPQLVADFDFAIDEQCHEFAECDRLAPFVRAGKAVLNAEYTGTTESFCPRARELGLSSMLKRLALDSWREAC